MDAALRRNADFASKPCVLQHFGSPPFNSITSKYCKGYKFHKKEDFKMLKNRGVVPGPVTVVSPIIYKVLYIPGGYPDFFHQHHDIFCFGGDRSKNLDGQSTASSSTHGVLVPLYRPMTESRLGDLSRKNSAHGTT